MKVQGIYQYTKQIDYATHCHIDREYGIFRDYRIMVSKNYINNHLLSTIYNVKDAAGNFVKSKLKYFSNGKAWKVLTSKNDGGIYG